MDIKTLRKKMELYYKSIVSVYCPIIDDTIYFSSSGFNHLIYDTNRNPRNVNEQYLKLKCLTLVKEVIEKCTLITETRKVTSADGKVVTFYSLEFEKTRVIIKKKGTGKHKFLSVMKLVKRNKNKNHRQG